MGLKCAIIGLPNVGKSTLFNVLTQANIEAANYPFCTIEPNIGTVAVPDQRLQKLAECVKPDKTIPTSIQFIDIAGLVEGAAQGEGLGNQFLAHIRETDAIAHVVRCFEDTQVSHVTGTPHPQHDIDIIHTELALADLATVEKALLKAHKLSKSGDKDAQKTEALLSRCQQHLEEGKALRHLNFDETEALLIKQLGLLTAKPMFYIANSDDPKSEATLVKAVAESEGHDYVVICAQLELEISELAPDDRDEFIQEMGLQERGLDALIRTAYHTLNLSTYYTAGPKEVRAWTIPHHALAPEAAAVIHTDFQKGFICVEVIPYDAFIEYGSEQAAKTAGKLRLEGKEYPVCDGDIMHFRFNV